MTARNARDLFRLNLMKFHCRLPIEPFVRQDRTTDGVGDTTSRPRLLAEGAEPRAIMERLRSEPGCEGLVERVRSFIDSAVEERELAALDALGAGWVAFGHEGYPSSLDDVADPPLVLYHRGRLALLHVRCVAIVGSRRATVAGTSVAERIARTCADAGLTVVSGLARGVDGAAHRGALGSSRGSTAAVLGCGIDVTYPVENRRLQAAIGERGVVVTEFPLGFGPRAYHFPLRNRLIAWLAEATVVVEAGPGSGSLITARYAHDESRMVLAVPGLVGRAACAGTNELIRDGGATLVRGPDDVLEDLGVSAAGSGGRAKLEALGADVAAVYDLIDEGRHTLDELLGAGGFEFGRLNRALFELMRRGFVQREAGSLYRIAAGAP